MRYSKSFEMVNFRVYVLVDNAITHTKATLYINMFFKSQDTACPVEFLEWTDEQGNKHETDCRFRRGNLKGKSKGLLNLCKELKIIDENQD